MKTMMFGMVHGWGMGFGWFIGFFVLAAIVWLIVRSTQTTGNQSRPEKTALDILKERYARGEINKSEFEEKKRDII